MNQERQPSGENESVDIRGRPKCDCFRTENCINRTEIFGVQTCCMNGSGFINSGPKRISTCNPTLKGIGRKRPDGTVGQRIQKWGDSPIQGYLECRGISRSKCEVHGIDILALRVTRPAVIIDDLNTTWTMPAITDSRRTKKNHLSRNAKPRLATRIHAKFIRRKSYQVFKNSRSPLWLFHHNRTKE